MLIMLPDMGYPFFPRRADLVRDIQAPKVTSMILIPSVWQEAN
jgi:hypothetical protein